MRAWRHKIARVRVFAFACDYYSGALLLLAGSGDRPNIAGSHFCTMVFESWKTKFAMVVLP